MAEYRRFVAYVYEYRKGKKDVNCGFVRVEARNGICAMELHLKCPGLVFGETCRVYGFVRRGERMEGVLLGSCMTGEGQVDCRLETDAGNMGQSGISLNQTGGMVFRTDSGAFFGTEWDDIPIVPSDFHDISEVGEEPENGDVSEEEPETENGAGGEMPETEHSETVVPEPEPADISAETPEDGSNAEMRAEEVAAPMDHPCCNAPSKACREPEELGEPFSPFGDGEFEYCRKIQPRDLMCLSRRECALRNNRFLSHGYYNFGHLLLGRRRDGQYILGVPGGYDQQEHFMAGMFGFPYFRESGYIELDSGNGGYWYRLIDAPNLR